MASRSSKKRLGKVTGAQYSLLKELTDESTLNAATLETALAEIVRDRFDMARGLRMAAKILVETENSLIRRSAVSRAYYGAYQAARATLLSVAHRDEDDHDRLANEIDLLKGLQGSGAKLKELRTRRNEFDYSPYPGPDERRVFDVSEIETIIQESVETAETLVRAFEQHLKERR